MSASQVKLYEVEDPFATLDAFWKVSPAKREEKAETFDKPPTVLSGGAPRSVARMEKPSAEAEPQLDDINSFLDDLGRSK